MLVDDEINILEGIARIVDWKKCNTVLSGKAHHGQQALEMITKTPPDIVITDIKMPGLNGIELIEKVHAIYPKIKFIILSGHDEFDFAKTAMQYGVKYYLLKPSNRIKIEDTLRNIISELEKEDLQDNFIEDIKEKFNKVTPIAQKQFLSEYIVNKSFGAKEWKYYQQLFEMQPITDDLRLLVMVVDEQHDFKQLFILKEIMLQEISTDMVIHLATTIGEKVVILLEDQPLEKLLTKIKSVKKTYKDYYHRTFTTAISNSAKISRVQGLYQEANSCLTQRFYLGNGSVITMSDLQQYKTDFKDIQFDYDNIIFSIKSGDQKQVQDGIDEFFEKIKEEQLEVNIVKSYCLELLMAIIRQAKSEDVDHLLAQTKHFQEFETLGEIKIFLEQLSKELSFQYYDETRKTQHNIIKKITHYLEGHLSDELLSLSQIAEDVVYMNSDYLGRLFKKEIGKNFSTYLIELRIKKAIELIEDLETVRIFEIANKVGFGNNPRYFGQVFKKHTGVTPTDYKQRLMDIQ